jgi:hypothetical protein
MKRSLNLGRKGKDDFYELDEESEKNDESVHSQIESRERSLPDVSRSLPIFSNTLTQTPNSNPNPNPNPIPNPIPIPNPNPIPNSNPNTNTNSNQEEPIEEVGFEVEQRGFLCLIKSDSRPWYRQLLSPSIDSTTDLPEQRCSSIPLLLVAGTQHTAAMFPSLTLAPVILITSSKWYDPYADPDHLSDGRILTKLDVVNAISFFLMASAIATFINVARFGPIGSHLLSVMGTTYSFFSMSIPALDQSGLSLVFGMTLAASPTLLLLGMCYEMKGWLKIIKKTHF